MVISLYMSPLGESPTMRGFHQFTKLRSVTKTMGITDQRISWVSPITTILGDITITTIPAGITITTIRAGITYHSEFFPPPLPGHCSSYSPGLGQGLDHQSTDSRTGFSSKNKDPQTVPICLQSQAQEERDLKAPAQVGKSRKRARTSLTQNIIPGPGELWSDTVLGPGHVFFSPNTTLSQTVQICLF